MKSKIKEQTNLISMQENLGLGHKGNILITTQERINKNLPPIANNILDEDFAYLICKRINNFDDLLSACKAQHKAIDILFALLIEKDEKFFPSKSGLPWKAIQQGNRAIEDAESE